MSVFFPNERQEGCGSKHKSRWDKLVKREGKPQLEYVEWRKFYFLKSFIYHLRGRNNPKLFIWSNIALTVHNILNAVHFIN